MHKQAAMLMAALLMFSAEAMAARPTRLPPRDECAAVPSFVAYRAKLVAAIQRRDVAALRKLTAPDVDTSLGGDRPHGEGLGPPRLLLHVTSAAQGGGGRQGATGEAR